MEACSGEALGEELVCFKLQSQACCRLGAADMYGAGPQMTTFGICNADLHRAQVPCNVARVAGGRHWSAAGVSRRVNCGIVPSGCSQSA